MATLFTRVILSEDAPDFEPMTLELGVPLLDKSNAVFRIVARWLGRLAAEPEWREQAVGFYVCDDQGARLNNVECEPATADDLRRDAGLKQDLQEISDRLEAVQPQNAMEQSVRDVVLRDFRQLVDEAGPAHKACHFFKYRQGKDWRLVWCWGYARTDQEPAHPAICTNPACKALFVRRGAGSRSCPHCKGAKSRKKPILPAVLAALLLLLLLGGGAYYFWSQRGGGPPVAVTPDIPGNAPRQPAFFATPESWRGPAGAHINFKVTRTDAQGDQEDVTSRVVVVVENPKVVGVSHLSEGAEAKSAGSTVVHFYLGGDVARATLVVDPPLNPERLILEPAEATLGFGSTLAVRVMGQYKAGEPVDLTDAVEWLPPEGRSVYFFNGLLEGVKPGAAKVRVRYRSSPAADYITASLDVNVLEEKYTALAISLDPPQPLAGKSARLSATVTTEGGATRSVLGSSKLEWSVEPPPLAEIEDGFLAAKRLGEGVLKASFQGLQATLDLAIAEESEKSRFEVKPTALQLAVGEQTALGISTTSDAPIRVKSSDSGVVEILPDRRIVGRAPGNATLTVQQGRSRAEVSVEVAAIAFKSLAIEPSRISAPVGGAAVLRVVAVKPDDTTVEIAPDQLSWEQLPAASFAEIDLNTLEVKGLQPTHDSPQPVTVRLGPLKAQGQIDVVTRPLQVALTPVGPVALPEGSELQLQAWANYADGRRVEIPADDVQWNFPAADESGLAFNPTQGLLQATKAGGEKVRVQATYLGAESNAVEISSVAAEAVALAITTDRQIVLVDETGVVSVDFENRKSGDESELAGVVFSSSDDAILLVDSATGAFRALAKGAATVEANHPAASAPVQLEFQVVAPEEVKLVLRPAEVQLPVGGQTEMALYLTAPGGEVRISMLGGENGAVRMANKNPTAVAWTPPLLLGLQASDTFRIGARFQGLTAIARVTVVEASGVLRIVPETATLAPGQPLALRVERRVGEADQWSEVDPALVDWTIPPAVDWTPATAATGVVLRPRVVLRDELAEPAVLQAEVGGESATFTLSSQSVDDVLDPADPSVSIVIVREPPGEELEEGRQQRYTVVLEKDGQREPAANFIFEPAFENEFVRWTPPILHAKRRGHRQRLRVKVGDDILGFETTTIGPAAASPTDDNPAQDLAPSDETPAAVRIVSGQGSELTLPIGARYDDIQVLATFPDGERDVSGEASLIVENADENAPAISMSAGLLSARRAGAANMHAAFHGVGSEQPLRVTVAADLPLTALSLDPEQTELGVGESISLGVLGFIGRGEERRSVGDVSSRADVSIASENRSAADVQGNVLTGLAAGEAEITASMGGLSATGVVNVVPLESSDDLPPMLVAPRRVRLRIGETAWLGDDITVTRGGGDFSNNAEAAVANPAIAQFNSETGALVGVAPGETMLAITLGQQSGSVAVEVLPDEPSTGTVVVEPAVLSLSEGEVAEVRVFLIDENGQRIDRTASAIVRAQKADVLAVSGNRLTGLAVGSSRIAALLPEAERPGFASATVDAEDYTQLTLSPPQMQLNVAEETGFSVFAVGPNGRRELGEHPDLQITLGGAAPGSIELLGAQRVRGAAPGEARINVTWRDLPTRSIAVAVVDQTPDRLRIEPNDTTVAVHGTTSFLAFVRQGGRERIVTAADGLEFRLGNPEAAEPLAGLTVRGLAPGRTTAIVSLDGLRAVAQVEGTR